MDQNDFINSHANFNKLNDDLKGRINKEIDILINSMKKDVINIVNNKTSELEKNHKNDLNSLNDKLNQLKTAQSASQTAANAPQSHADEDNDDDMVSPVGPPKTSPAAPVSATPAAGPTPPPLPKNKTDSFWGDVRSGVARGATGMGLGGAYMGGVPGALAGAAAGGIGGGLYGAWKNWKKRANPAEDLGRFVGKQWDNFKSGYNKRNENYINKLNHLVFTEQFNNYCSVINENLNLQYYIKTSLPIKQYVESVLLQYLLETDLSDISKPIDDKEEASDDLIRDLDNKIMGVLDQYKSKIIHMLMNFHKDIHSGLNPDVTQITGKREIGVSGRKRGRPFGSGKKSGEPKAEAKPEVRPEPKPEPESTEAELGPDDLPRPNSARV
jgi:hypothetical protein